MLLPHFRSAILAKLGLKITLSTNKHSTFHYSFSVPQNVAYIQLVTTSRLIFSFPALFSLFFPLHVLSSHLLSSAHSLLSSPWAVSLCQVQLSKTREWRLSWGNLVNCITKSPVCLLVSRLAFVLVQRRQQQWREQATSLWPTNLWARPESQRSNHFGMTKTWAPQSLILSPVVCYEGSWGTSSAAHVSLWTRGVDRGGGGCSGRAVTFRMMSGFPITVLTRDPLRWFNGGILFLLTSPLFVPRSGSPRH